MPDSTEALRQATRENYANLPRHRLTICASLVQNPANLGALCRTAEAFRLERLVLSSLAIARTATFRNLSVATHRWQPLVACAPAALLDWLSAQQQQGYTLVALHASAEAIPLPEFRFPAQSLLVLGRELTGIPAEVVERCDRILSIPQFGLVDSLNVQTAAAIASYEYVRQHSLMGMRSCPNFRQD